MASLGEFLNAMSSVQARKGQVDAARNGGYNRSPYPTSPGYGGVQGVATLSPVVGRGAVGPLQRGPMGVLAPIAGSAQAVAQFLGQGVAGASWPNVADGSGSAGAGVGGYGPSILGVMGQAGARIPNGEAMTPTEMMAAARAREAMAKQKAAAPAARIIAARPATKATKPGAAPSTRGRVVDRPAASGRGAAGVGVNRPTPAYGGATQAQIGGLANYLGYGTQAAPTPAYGGGTPQQIAGLANFLGYPSGPPPMSQNQIADFIATATPTAPVSPYATMNQYGGTSGPPAISVQNSQQAAAIAARNATADQLASAEFRATLNELLKEAGIAPQF